MKTLIVSIFTVLLSFSSAFLLAAETDQSQSAEAVQTQQMVNINSADVTVLSSLKGVGMKKAEAIIAWREANGAFKTVDQLLEVKGIGAAILDANHERLSLK